MTVSRRKEKEMASFHYEWWTVEITDQAGTLVWEFKGKSKESVIRQINKEVQDTNSEENQQRDMLHRRARILNVNWDSLKLDRTGYQRLF